jgi:hypothetical protein
MDIGKAFSYVFEDEGWISKILIGGLVVLIPFVGWLAAAGYMMKVAQNVAQGNQRPLPAWNEFGEHFMRGLHVLVIGLVYAIPVLIVTIPYIFIVIASASSGRGGEAVGGLLACLFVPLMIILGLLSSLLSYAALARYVTTNNLSDALKFSEVIASVRSNFMPWLMLLLVGILAQFVGSLGGVACGVGALFTGFYAMCVQGHALGQTVAKQNPTLNPYTTQQMPPVDYNPPSMQ